MLHISSKDKPTTSVSSSNFSSQALTGVSPLVTLPSRAHRFWRAMRSYPIPLGSLLLLAASLILWLVGRGDIANWTLLAVVLLGGLPLLWETVWQFARREFGIDTIAILAIAGSLWLGEYLAGAFVVLMLSGGEATDILRVARGIRLGRHVMRVALEGIWVGMGLSVIAMGLAAAGFIIPATGAILQEAIDVIVILKALRAGRLAFSSRYLGLHRNWELGLLRTKSYPSCARSARR